jgi:hypothetical protein
MNLWRGGGRSIVIFIENFGLNQKESLLTVVKKNNSQINNNLLV